jgi:hypothetical protein
MPNHMLAPLLALSLSLFPIEARPEAGVSNPFIPSSETMNDDEEFILKVYHKGVVSRMPVRGRKRFLLERSFLDNIMVQEFGGRRDKTRPIGDPSRDFFEVNDEQFDAYVTFRQQMKRESR